MRILKNRESITEYIAEIKKKGKTIGFVPTMGALHTGHLSLISQSKKETDITICSIYINPTQFDQAADLKNYPITIDEDVEKLKTIGCDVVFLPSEKDIYPNGKASLLKLDFGGIEKSMEGEYRSGHFDGVATVVNNFFELLTPDKAFFGEKDYQQLRIVQKMNDLTQQNVTVVGCEIVREKDGLAMSSRNKLLNEEDRQKAVFISDILSKMVEKSAKATPIELQLMAYSLFDLNPAFELDYFEIVSSNTLQPILAWEKTPARAFVAAKIGKVRLIDNMLLKN